MNKPLKSLNKLIIITIVIILNIMTSSLNKIPPLLMGKNYKFKSCLVNNINISLKDINKKWDDIWG